jgi:hypothetical protein
LTRYSAASLGGIVLRHGGAEIREPATGGVVLLFVPGVRGIARGAHHALLMVEVIPGDREQRAENLPDALMIRPGERRLMQLATQ